MIRLKRGNAEFFIKMRCNLINLLRSVIGETMSNTADNGNLGRMLRLSMR